MAVMRNDETDALDRARTAGDTAQIRQLAANRAMLS